MTIVPKRMLATHVLVVVHLVITSVLLGVIWFIQIVHYPQFRRLGDGFTRYISQNRWQTAYLLVPVMLLEGAAALLLVIWPPPGVGRSLTWLSLVLVIFAWLSTFFIQVPCHMKLSKQRDEQVLNRLIHTNWIRTIVWSVRSLVATGILLLDFVIPGS